jgi:hypothetical protein
MKQLAATAAAIITSCSWPSIICKTDGDLLAVLAGELFDAGALVGVVGRAFFVAGDLLGTLEA